MSRLVFIVPFRNVSSFISDCYKSLLFQSNPNWIAVFCDDDSSDGTSDLIPENPKFFKRKNEKRREKIWNQVMTIYLF
jgi:glycosyltransferase involved in cell wall biosynthesis